MTRKRLLLSALGLASLIIFWEAAATVVQYTAKNPTLILPHLSYVFTGSLPHIASFGDASASVPGSTPGVPHGGLKDGTVSQALAILVNETLVTVRRALLGMAIGVVAGVALGAATALSNVFRLIFYPLLNTLRQVPLFSFTLLFIIWFGGSVVGIYTFVIYGVALILMATTMEALHNVPRVNLDYAATLGAGRIQRMRTVLLPAIIPEVTSGILVATGLSWAMVLATGFLGTQHGLGRMLLFFELFQQTPQMVLVGIIFIALAVTTQIILSVTFRRITRWVPRTSATSGPQ